MDDSSRFLILSLGGDNYALPITKLIEISVPRNLQKDAKLTELFEGKIVHRGKTIPVMDVKKVFKISGPPGAALLVVRCAKGVLGLLVDSVTEIMDTAQQATPLPAGIMNPSLQYYRGILRHKDSLVLLLNEDGLLP